MAPIFASPDIAALVAAFPPSLPTRSRPSLVKSHSGSNLLDSRKVLARFRVLLETSTGRIKKSDLPSRLGIESADWLLDCYDSDLYYSKDWQTLVPSQEAQELFERFKTQAQNELVELGDFASRHDIARQSCEQLLASASDLRHFSLSDGRSLVGGRSLIDRLKEQIASNVKQANGDRVDLSSANSPVPFAALLELAEETLEQLGGGGSLEKIGEKLVYVPADYQKLQQKKQDEVHQATIAALLNDLATDGYCEVTGDATTLNSETLDTAPPHATDVAATYRKENEDVDLVTFDQATGPTIVAKQSFVNTAMEELDGIVRAFTRDSRNIDRSSVSLKALEETLCAETSYLGLTKRLLQSSEHRKSLEASLASAIKGVEVKESQQFADLCRSSFLAPLELYGQGLQTVSDQTLNERLSQYVCEHFRSETLPGLTLAVRNVNLLHDKARAKDLDKLTAASAQAKTVADLRSAASKFCRKQKIAMPDPDQFNEAKREVLQAKLRNVQQMSRGSDILQNLCWILLAKKNDGLFMSAGKDTSRIIKHYQSVGDAENGQQLEQWRDALKAGKQSDEDVQQMKTMAADVVKSMCGDEDSHRDG